MDSARHEIIVTPENVPAYIVIHDASVALSDNAIPHWHEELELVCSLDSWLDVRRDAERFQVRENDLVVMGSGQVHTIVPVIGHANHGVSIAFKREFLFKYGKYEGDSLIIIDVNPEAKAKIVEYMQEIDRQYRSEVKERYMNLKVNGMLCAIAYLLLTFFQPVNRPDRKHSFKYRERYLRIMEYMEDHYNEPLSLGDVAEHSGLSKEHLSREFKNYIGEGFREHLSTIRVMKAQHDLLYSDMPLMDLAIRHGFNDLRSYNRAFQRQFGTSPTQYRKDFKKE